MPTPLSLAQLLAPVPLADWKAKIIEVADAVGLETENWVEGGYTRTLVALFAQLYASLGDVVRIIAASGFLDTAEGDWLTFLARNVFNVTRIEATYAAASQGITLINNGGGLFVFEAGDVILAHADTRKTYRNTSGGTLNPGLGQTVKLDIIAESAGSDSNAIPGSITNMVTTFLGVTCTNEKSLAGLDAETDESLRQRCRDSLAAFSPGGPASAYEFVAKSATRPDGSSVGITRVMVMPPPGDGTLTVYLAGASGAVPTSDVDIVQEAFDQKATPYGFDVAALSATNLAVSVPNTIWIPASLGLSIEQAQQIVHDALEAYVQSLPIGGVIITPATGAIYWRALLGVIEGAIPGSLKALLATEADIPVAVGKVPVWAGAVHDTTVLQVA